MDENNLKLLLKVKNSLRHLRGNLNQVAQIHVCVCRKRE